MGITANGIALRFSCSAEGETKLVSRWSNRRGRGTNPPDIHTCWKKYLTETLTLHSLKGITQRTKIIFNGKVHDYIVKVICYYWFIITVDCEAGSCWDSIIALTVFILCRQNPFRALLWVMLKLSNSTITQRWYSNMSLYFTPAKNATRPLIIILLNQL